MTILHGKVSLSTLPVSQSIKLFYGMVVLLMIITLHSHICKADLTHLSVCHHNVNYTKGGKLERYLNTVINRLIKDAFRTGFHKLAILFCVSGGFLLMLSACLFANGRRLKLARFEGHGQVEEDTGIGHDGQHTFTMENEDTAIRQDGQHTFTMEKEDTVIGQGWQNTFTMEELIAATENFHDNNKVGQGTFGAVYKGTTEDGKAIAVKKLFLKSPQRKKDFLNEVKLVARFQHRNLVNILGSCTEGSERLLVYEYLPNKSLDKILFNPNKLNQLDWQKRYNIIVGIARGLLYLHEDSPLRIIHRDIKASNILLDENLNPKIADFGLARLVSEHNSHDSTGAAGTFWYMAPEYAMKGQLSVKADVYSFGIIILELVTGRKNIPSLETQMLLGWAWSLYNQRNSVDMIDPTIIESCDDEQAVRCIQVALLCTQDSSLRPSISRVTLMLSSNSEILPDPTQPAFATSHLSRYYI